MEMARKCTLDGTKTEGKFKVLTREDVEQIYRMAK